MDCCCGVFYQLGADGADDSPAPPNRGSLPLITAWVSPFLSVAEVVRVSKHDIGTVEDVLGTMIAFGQVRKHCLGPALNMEAGDRSVLLYRAASADGLGTWGGWLQYGSTPAAQIATESGGS